VPYASLTVQPLSREDSLVSFGAAGNQETEHACPVLRREEFDHAGVEFVATRGRDADRIKSMRHEMPVHHVTGSALVPVEIKLLKGGEQEVRNGLLEGIVQFNLNELYATGIDPAEILTAWLGSRWHVAAARTESDA
jgi:hypothetical protein